MCEVTFSVVMFAYNEEKNIAKSVDSVLANSSSNLNQLMVIANGCTDSTVDVLNKLKSKAGYEKLKLVEIELGDKCNAWNKYVHYLHDDADVHFFTDADVEFTTNAFVLMAARLSKSPEANAIAGLPFSGRNIEEYRKMVTEFKCLFGNCYALKREFLDLVKAKQFYLPRGLCWIDSAITKVVKRDIEDIDAPNQSRVVFDINAGYKFKSLSPFKLDDIKLYLSRVARYQAGKFQETYLEKISFVAWPRVLNEINQKVLERIEKGELKVKFYLKSRVMKRLKKVIK